MSTSSIQKNAFLICELSDSLLIEPSLDLFGFHSVLQYFSSQMLPFAQSCSSLQGFIDFLMYFLNLIVSVTEQLLHCFLTACKVLDGPKVEGLGSRSESPAVSMAV